MDDGSGESSAISVASDIIFLTSALLNESKDGYKVMLGGPSCLAGDIIGEYNFKSIPKVGDRIAILDQAHYTMVKTSFFNGVKIPSVAIWDSDNDNLEVIKRFTYEDFENKLI